MSENFTEILLIKMKSARDGEDWQGEKDWIPDTSSPPPSQIFLFFWNIPLSAIIKRATVSDCGISTSGEGRDFSEIIAVFLQRNIFEKQKGLRYGGKQGKGGGWQGCRVGAGHFPLPALICQLAGGRMNLVVQAGCLGQ